MIIPSERNKHIILICKGHHDKENTLQALRDFISDWCGIDPEQVSGATMYECLLNTMSEISDKNILIRFIQDIFRFETLVGYETVMRQMASIIANTRVRDNDGTILMDLYTDHEFQS